MYIHIHDLHAQVPNVNTLFVPIGKLYHRSDFAGVLINLNVNEAIIRGKEALEVMTNFSITNDQGKKLVLGLARIGASISFI